MPRARNFVFAALCMALALAVIACDPDAPDDVRLTPTPSQPPAIVNPNPTVAQPSASATPIPPAAQPPASANPNPTAARPLATATPIPTAARPLATATANPTAARPLATATPNPNPTPAQPPATATPNPNPTPAQPPATATPNPNPTPAQPPSAPLENPPIIALDGGGASPTVSVGGAAFEVEIAFTPEERTRGLSGRDSLADGAGMLFVFDSGAASSFWMREMRFALDFVWIGDGCEVVDILPDVPAPAAGTALGDLPIYSSRTPARYNLEINAGEAAARGIEIGDAVKFSGFSGEGATCR